MKSAFKHPCLTGTPSTARRVGFTLIELLVVISIIALLLGILLPALGSARETGRGAVCLSNIRQLVTANSAYAEDNAGYYTHAAIDVYSSNLKRWHGIRKSTAGPVEDQTFNPTGSPLAGYLGHTGAIRECPTFDNTFDHDAPGFERGNGGYGYNSAYIGGRRDLFGTNAKSVKHTARASDVQTPTETVMFTDTAFNKFVSGTAKIIEYSFAEPPKVQQFPQIQPTLWNAPSVHFRHHDNTHAAWADGHVTPQQMDFTHPQFEEFYTQRGFGWFGPETIELFDLE